MYFENKVDQGKVICRGNVVFANKITMTKLFFFSSYTEKLFIIKSSIIIIIFTKSQ